MVDIDQLGDFDRVDYSDGEETPGTTSIFRSMEAIRSSVAD